MTEAEPVNTVTLTDHLERVQRRKAVLGIADTPARSDGLRNKGGSRTPEKRELLARAAARARAAGREPITAYY